MVTRSEQMIVSTFTSGPIVEEFLATKSTKSTKNRIPSFPSGVTGDSNKFIFLSFLCSLWLKSKNLRSDHNPLLPTPRLPHRPRPLRVSFYSSNPRFITPISSPPFHHPHFITPVLRPLATLSAFAVQFFSCGHRGSRREACRSRFSASALPPSLPPSL